MTEQSTQETYLRSRNELDHLEPDFAEQILDFQENNKNKQKVLKHKEYLNPHCTKSFTLHAWNKEKTIDKDVL